MQYGASTGTGAEEITSGMVASMSAGQLSSMAPDGLEATEPRRTTSTESADDDLHHDDTHALSLRLPHDRAEGVRVTDAAVPKARQPSLSAGTSGQLSGVTAVEGVASDIVQPPEHETTPKKLGNQALLGAPALPGGGEDDASLLAPTKRSERSGSLGSAPQPHFQLASRPAHASLAKHSPSAPASAANRRPSERKTLEEDTLRAIVQVGYLYVAATVFWLLCALCRKSYKHSTLQALRDNDTGEALKLAETRLNELKV